MPKNYRAKQNLLVFLLILGSSYCFDQNELDYIAEETDSTDFLRDIGASLSRGVTIFTEYQKLQEKTLSEKKNEFSAITSSLTKLENSIVAALAQKEEKCSSISKIEQSTQKQIMDVEQSKLQMMIDIMKKEQEQFSSHLREIKDSVRIQLNKPQPNMTAWMMNLKQFKDEFKQQLQSQETKLETTIEDYKKIKYQLGETDAMVTIVKFNQEQSNIQQNDFTDQLKSLSSTVANLMISQEDLREELSYLIENMTTINTDKQRCPSPFAPVAGGCFYYHCNSKLNWTQSQNHCRLIGGDLAEPELHSLETLKLYLRNFQDSTDVWLGARDSVVEGKWVWERSGLYVGDSFHWAEDQPNNGGLLSSPQNCLELSATWDYSANDQECYSRNYFLCQYWLEDE